MKISSFLLSLGLAVLLIQPAYAGHSGPDRDRRNSQEMRQARSRELPPKITVPTVRHEQPHDRYNAPRHIERPHRFIEDRRIAIERPHHPIRYYRPYEIGRPLRATYWPVSIGLMRQFGPPPYGTSYVIVDHDVLLVSNLTMEVLRLVAVLTI